MITDETIKRRVVLWASKVGSRKAIDKLKRVGVGDRMARYLVNGSYIHNISLKKAEQIMGALK